MGEKRQMKPRAPGALKAHDVVATQGRVQRLRPQALKLRVTVVILGWKLGTSTVSIHSYSTSHEFITYLPSPCSPVKAGLVVGQLALATELATRLAHRFVSTFSW